MKTGEKVRAQQEQPPSLPVVFVGVTETSITAHMTQLISTTRFQQGA
jgi:hypothetical protein